MRTIVDQIKETPSGVLEIRMQKINDDGTIGYHRTTVAPGASVDSQMNAVNAHLQSMGMATVGNGDISKVKAIASRVHTKEVIEEFKRRT
jgi:hypothetical protein